MKHPSVLSQQSMASVVRIATQRPYKHVSRLQPLSTQENWLQQRPLCVAVFLAWSCVVFKGKIADPSNRTLRFLGDDNSSIGDLVVAAALASSCAAVAPLVFTLFAKPGAGLHCKVTSESHLAERRASLFTTNMCISSESARLQGGP